MSVNTRALAVTGIIVAAVTYAICAAFVGLAPDAATTIGSFIVHMDLSKVGRAITWPGAFIGLVFFTGFVALICAGSGWVYNRLARS
jgi:hypothetical protein